MSTKPIGIIHLRLFLYTNTSTKMRPSSTRISPSILLAVSSARPCIVLAESGYEPGWLQILVDLRLARQRLAID